MATSEAPPVHEPATTAWHAALARRAKLPILEVAERSGELPTPGIHQSLRKARNGSASDLGCGFEKRVKLLVADGERPVEAVLEVRCQPGNGVPASPLKQVYAHPLGSHIEPEALAYVEIHGFHFGKVLSTHRGRPQSRKGSRAEKSWSRK